MGTKNFNEFAVSGEIDNMVIAEQLGFVSATDPSYDGMFLRLQGGVVYGYRAPDEDTHWTDTDATDILLTTTPVEVLAITVDEDLTPDNGSYAISGQIDNARNQELTVDVTIKDDGVQVGVGNITLQANEKGKNFVFAGSLNNNIASGSVITVEFDGSQSDQLTLKGTVINTKIELTLAGGSPVAANTAGITKDVTIGNGHNKKTLHIENGLIKSVT